ncbi:MAG: energy transducer TonB [Candidatus Sulfotelmatobacter sp.]
MTRWYCLLIWLVTAASVAVAAQTEPVLISANIPKYPPLASQARIEGVVKLTFTLPGNGAQPTNVEVVSGHPMLKSAAAENLKTWRFENPYALERKYETTFKYRLSGAEVAGERKVSVTFESFREVEVVTDVAPPTVNY